MQRDHGSDTSRSWHQNVAREQVLQNMTSAKSKRIFDVDDPTSTHFDHAEMNERAKEHTN